MEKIANFRMLPKIMQKFSLAAGFSLKKCQNFCIFLMQNGQRFRLRLDENPELASPKRKSWRRHWGKGWVGFQVNEF